MADDAPMTKEEVERLRGWAEGRELLHLTPSQVRRLLAGLDAAEAERDELRARLKRLAKACAIFERNSAGASEEFEARKRAEAERDRLRAAIAAHRSQRGDDRCWLDDQTLYAVLGDGDSGDNSLPCRTDFLANCERYYDSRCRNAGWRGYQELEQDNARLAARVAELEAAAAWQPISNFPGAIDTVLVMDGKARSTAYRDSAGRWHLAGSKMQERLCYPPTHWMPLPAPPADLRKGG